MLAIKGVYNGKSVIISPSEKAPHINHEVAVAIIFLEEFNEKQERSVRLLEIARKMRARREKMMPLNMNIKELVEAGRER